MTHVDRVEKWLRSGKSITSQGAWNRWNNTRLADTIHKLRKRGIPIVTEEVRIEGAKYAKYRLLKGAGNV